MKLQQRRDIELMILDHQDTCDIIKHSFSNPEEVSKLKENYVMRKSNGLRKIGPQSTNLKQYDKLFFILIFESFKL